MKINYANNPLLGTGKWDPLLSLLTPGGDSITVPANVFTAIRCRCRGMGKQGIAFFITSLANGKCTVARVNSIESTRHCGRQSKPRGYWLATLESMKIGKKYYFENNDEHGLKNAATKMKQTMRGEYRLNHPQGKKLHVVRTK